jgi:hypothetical protein
MFAQGLEVLRYQIENEQRWAAELLDTVRATMATRAAAGKIGPNLLMLLMNAFIDARLEPGDALTRQLGELAATAAGSGDRRRDPNADIEALFASILETAGEDEFQVHAGLAEISQALPPSFRQAILESLTSAANPVLRDTAILYLLDPAAEVRQALCQLLTEQNARDLVSPHSLRRMIALRNWLPEEERPALDQAIRMARQQHVDCATWPGGRVREILVSNIDGAGAQSAFAVVESDQREVIASLLVKQDVGIADAWCTRTQSPQEVESFVGHILEQTDSIAVSPAFLQRLIGHHLAVGQAQGTVPKPGLLDFVEAVGIVGCQPAALDLDDLIALIAEDVSPAVLDQAMVADVLDDSAGWIERFDFMDSWFEDDALVDRVLAARPRARKSTKVEAILEQVLEPRRRKWAERFLWTALWLQQRPDQDQLWPGFFLVGRELGRGRPVADMPVMRSLADLTLAAKCSPWY